MSVTFRSSVGGFESVLDDYMQYVKMPDSIIRINLKSGVVTSVSKKVWDTLYSLAKPVDVPAYRDMVNAGWAKEVK